MGIIDVREPDQFWALHAKGSLNFALGTHGGLVLGHEDGNFALWLGRMSEGEKIALVVDSERRQEAMVRLARVGLLKFATGTVDAADFNANAKDSSIAFMSSCRYTVEDLKRADGLRFLDVRTPDEFKCPKGGTIKGAINLELDQNMTQAAEKAGLEKGTKYVCFCAGGFRSSIAASFLVRAGYDVSDIKYGYPIVALEYRELTTLI